MIQKEIVDGRVIEVKRRLAEALNKPKDEPKPEPKADKK